MKVLSATTIAYTLVLSLMSAQVAGAEDSKRIQPEVVPLVRLISSPDRYSGKEVITFGVLKIAFKEDVLYMSTEDAEHAVIPNGLDLEFTSESLSREAVSIYSGKIVMIRGRFEPTPDVFGRVAAGMLLAITEVVPSEEWQ